MNRPFSKKHLHSKEPRPFFASFYGNDPAAANEKHPSPHKKRGRLASKRKFKIHPASPFSGDIFSSDFYKRLKFSSIVFHFPFFPFLCRSHFHRLSIFIFHFRKLSFSSQYTQNYPHCIPLIHGILRSYPPYPQPYARFPDICRKLWANI